MVCESCLLVITAPPRRHLPTPCPPSMPPTWVVTSYDGPAREMLLDYKERGAVGLARPLGDALAASINAVAVDPSRPLHLVPAPSSAASIRTRGDDVVRLLADRAARRLRSPSRRVVVSAVLSQQRNVADSAGLTAAARASNLAGALTVRPALAHRIRGKTVVLVDDLVTTGATLSEASVALIRAGAQVVGAATVAATPRQMPPSTQNW